jgi:hypothetical protein
MDAWLLKIVGENWMSLYLILTLLKGLALLSKSTVDDKIMTMFSNVYNSLRTGKVPESLEDK